MNIRKVDNSSSNKLIIESMGYVDSKSAVPTRVSKGSSYVIHYVLSGRGYIGNHSVAGTDLAFKGNFADKIPYPTAYYGGTLQLPEDMITLIFFTAPETGIYTSTITVTGNEMARYCNIYYFIGNDIDGYRVVKVGNKVLRHDPIIDKVTFKNTVTMPKGDSLVIGVGNYIGVKLVVDEFSVENVSDENSEKWHLTPEIAPPFSAFVHPHAAQYSHIEKTAEGFILKPSVKIEYHPDPRNPWSYFYISLCGENVDELLKEHIHTDSYGVFCYCFSELINELKDMIFRTERPLPSSIALAIFYDILAEHVRPPVDFELNVHVEAAKEYMIKNFRRKLSVKDVANELHLSDRYLYNLFIKHEGISPKQYIDNLRVDKAKLMLSDKNKSITEISEFLGFSDVLSFSRFFSSHNGGIPPSVYRASVII